MNSQLLRPMTSGCRVLMTLSARLKLLSAMQIALERKLPEQVVDKAPGLLKSKLNFVDLAGSERWSEHGEMTHARISEMTSINQSLSNLVTVVARLTEGKPSHIPYRYAVT